MTRDAEDLYNYLSMSCLDRYNLKKRFTRFLPIFTFLWFLTLSVLVSNNVARADKLGDGTWSQSASPGTTTVTFTNTTALDSSSDIVLTFPSTATLDGAGTDIAVTGQGTPVRSNNTLDKTITITIDGTLAASTAITITMTDALSAYNTSTYAMESLAINTLLFNDTPADFGVALMTNTNETTVTASVPLFVNMALDDNSMELGTLSTASVSSAEQVYTINSNNQSGVVMQIATDGDLDDDSTNTIDAVSGGTVDAGSEEYGIAVVGAGGMTIDATYNTGDNPVVEAADDLANSGGAAVNGGTVTVTYKASIAGTTVAGEYDQVVTVTIATNA